MKFKDMNTYKNSDLIRLNKSSSGEEDFEGFLHIWAWRQSWSCDPGAANKLSFPLPKEAPQKNWL